MTGVQLLKRQIKRLLGVLGFEVRRTKTTQTHHHISVRQSMTEVLEHLSRLGFAPRTIIDVGVATGTRPLLDVFPKSEYLWIEPLVEYEENLKDLARRFSGRYVLACAGRRTAKTTMHVHTILTGSSLYEETDGKDVDGEPRVVDTIALDDLIETHHVSGDVLLKIDVQGAELDVIDGAVNLLAQCDVILLEVHLLQSIKDVPEFHTVVDHMHQLGFVIYDIVEGFNRPIDGALCTKDVVFVKQHGRFRQTHRWATAEQRRHELAEARRK